MYAEVGRILSDERYDRSTNLLRLQGWHGDELSRARDSGVIVRLGPAVCSVGALLGVALQSPLLLGLVGVTAIFGLFAPNHPVEMVANAIVAGRGGTPQPPNKAGRRFGCFVGAILLGGSAAGYATGSPALGAGLGLTLAALSAFVAVTNICVPSIMVTAFRGADACSQENLFATR